MNRRPVSFFAFTFFLIVIFLVGIIHATETGSLKVSPEVRSIIQDYIAKTAHSTPDIYEISLHAMLDTGETIRIGCSNLEKLNTPSDPEDVEAIIMNQVIFIHEGEVYDFTIPLVNKKGQPYAVTGIKVEHKGNKTKAECKKIALELSKGIGEVVQSTQE